MENKTTIFLSDNVENLAKIFLKKSSHANVFRKICCAFPNSRYKAWFSEYVIQQNNLQVLTGITFSSLEEVFQKQQIFSYSLDKLCLQPFYLEILCNEKLEKLNFNEMYRSLIEYLGESKKNRYSLSKKLGRLFYEYHLFDPEKTQNWHEPQNWQQALWQEIFLENQSIFSETNSKYSRNLEQRLFDEIHFFGFDFMPKTYFDYFYNLSKKIPINHYLFSPCKTYWEDMISSLELRRIKKAQRKNSISEAVILEEEGVFTSTNPLLVNWGKVGRNYQRIIGSYDIPTEENYGPTNSHTVIEIIRESILSSLPVEKRTEFLNDESIQIHKTGASKLREVEILYEHLYDWIFVKKIQPEDILVLSFDINAYAPFIHFVFSQKNAKIPYKMSHLSLSSQSFLADAVLKCFELVESRWEQNQIIELILNPLVQKKLEINANEAKRWIEWVEELKVMWGINSSHLEGLLGDKKRGKDIRSWEKGFERLLSSLTVYPEDSTKIDFSFPLPDIDFSEAEKMNRFVGFFQGLLAETAEIENQQKRKVSQWASVLENLLRSFSIPQKQTEEKSAESIIQNYIEELRTIARINDLEIDFSVFYEELKERLVKPSASYRSSHLDGVHFSSFVPTPSRAIYLLGMTEQSVNRSFQSIDLIDRKHIPMNKDTNRYRFLQALFFAKEYIWVSYCHLSPSDGNEIPSAYCVEELISEMEKISLTESFIFSHKPQKFHKDYFQKGSSLKTFSSKNYHLYNLFSQRKKVNPVLFQKLEISEENGEEEIYFSELFQFAKNPLRHFFHKNLNMKLQQSIYERKDESNFSLSSLEKYKIKQELFHMEDKLIMDQLKKRDKLPIGFFEKIEKNQIYFYSEELRNLLKFFSIEPKNLYSVKADPYYAHGKFEENVCPPLTLILDETKKLSLIGEIDRVHSSGLVLDITDSLSDKIRNWPKILIYLHLAYTHGFCPNIILLKKKKTFTLPFEQVKNALEKYLNYYFLSKSIPSPFLKGFINIFEKGTYSSWIKQYTRISDIDDIYLRWLFRNNRILLDSQTFDQWQAVFKETFESLL